MRLRPYTHPGRPTPSEQPLCAARAEVHFGARDARERRIGRGRSTVERRSSCAQKVPLMVGAMGPPSQPLPSGPFPGGPVAYATTCLLGPRRRRGTGNLQVGRPDLAAHVRQVGVDSLTAADRDAHRRPHGPPDVVGEVDDIAAGQEAEVEPARRLGPLGRRQRR